MVMAMWWCTLGIVHSLFLKDGNHSLNELISLLVSAWLFRLSELTSFIASPVAAAPTTHTTADPQTNPPIGEIKIMCYSAVYSSFANINESTAGADASVEMPKLHNIKATNSFYTHIVYHL